ncbi:iron-containing redox enzyme family protein [Actinosynnema sp. NPDC023587]|uniref:iron-containing redox enzyme family protein n=1 Tax=Actinosynnema sp. NPDC023587 TaxID=3154695 RepID=UPI0033FBFB04
MTHTLHALGAATLPAPRGRLSDAVIAALRADPSGWSAPAGAGDTDPYGEDLQLALHVCYELHYRGFRDAAPGWEWAPELIRLRSGLERVFLDALAADLPGRPGIDDVLDELLVEPVDGRGLSHHLLDRGEWWQVRENFAHRSIYHLKEADPHAWVIPRLTGRAKAALVAVEFDEYGGGRGDRMHSQLYARLLAGAGMETGYLHYLEHVPARMLATVNLMSLCGLHRELRGALVGHFAAAEITTAPSATRMAKALERLDAHPDCVEFYTEHIEADAVHEQVMRLDVVGDLLAREPELTESVVFGVRATGLLEQRLGDHLLTAWAEGRSSLLKPV